ncbi:hypothetical protein ACQPWW_14745 [Micromonospora sp. CA-240977]|uniref:hypothetical protein n=1 Tax=Micromonospora sp. CA-240977 TaxID=3239957 RepID=UPI003D8F9EC4
MFDASCGLLAWTRGGGGGGVGRDAGGKIAPDLLDKGVHFNVGKVEFAVRPTGDAANPVVLKPVHPGMARDLPRKVYEDALRRGEGALQSPEFRDWLAKHANAGFELAVKNSGHPKAIEFKFLLSALRGM